MVVLVGGFASRPMTDEMRGRDVRGGACVLFGRVAEPTFKPSNQKTTENTKQTKGKGNDDGMNFQPKQNRTH